MPKGCSKPSFWQRGGHRAYIGGPKEVGEFIRELYSPGVSVRSTER